MTYFDAAEVAKKEKVTQVAILLHSAGPEAQDVFQTFVFDEKEGNKKDVVADVLKKYREHCEPRKNEVYERYKFWQRDQKESETVDQWATDLRILMGSCEYDCCKDKVLRDKLVFGVADKRVKERLLRESKLTLDKALDICRAGETSKVQFQAMITDNSRDVHYVGRKKEGQREKRGKPRSSTAVQPTALT